MLLSSGLFLIPFAAFIAWIATRAEPPHPGVWAVIAVNLIWAAGSYAMLAGGAVSPNALGYGLLALQGAGAALLAWLEYVGLRKAAA